MNKKILSLFLVFVLMFSLAGCGDSKSDSDESGDKKSKVTKEAEPEVTDTPTPLPTSTPVPTETPIPEPTGIPAPVENQVKTYSMVTNENFTTCDTAKGFSEDRAWVVLKDDDNPSTLGGMTIALIDTEGKILYKLDTKTQFRDTVAIKGEELSVATTTYMKDGISVIYNAKGEGFIIIDKDGRETYNTNDGNDNTHHYYCGQYDNRLFCLTEESSFAENSIKLNIINCDGKVLQSDIVPGIKRLNRDIFHDGGEGFALGTYAAINMNNWTYISSIRPLSDFSDGYLAVSTDGQGPIAITAKDLDSQAAFDAAKKAKKNKIDQKTFGDKMSLLPKANYQNYRYVNIEGGEVVPKIPSTVELENTSGLTTRFEGGHAFIYMKGADEAYYITAIDTSGTTMFEPIKMDFMDYYGSYSAGYVPIAETHSGGFDDIITYDGRILKIAKDDCSELKDITLNYSQSEWPVLKGGYFCGYNVEALRSKYQKGVDFYVSLDGKKIIDKAIEYTVIPEDDLQVIDEIFYINPEILGMSFSKLNERLGGNLPKAEPWEWGTYDSFFDYEYKGRNYTFFLLNSRLYAVRYEVSGKSFENFRYDAYRAQYGEPKRFTYDDGSVIPADQTNSGYRYYMGSWNLDLFYNRYDDADHIAMHYSFVG